MSFPLLFMLHIVTRHFEKLRLQAGFMVELEELCWSHLIPDIIVRVWQTPFAYD
jgi:hypothetical protein